MQRVLLSFLFIACLISTSGNSQNYPVDFETGGFGELWTWTVFENDTNPPLEIISNPDMTGANTSATVAKFTALQLGAPFAGVETMHGSDIGTFDLTADNAFVTIWVWKSVISNVGIKFVTPSSASTGEFLVPNTLVNQWEALTFDFTAKIGEPTSTGIDQIVIFPDFDARSSDNIIYFDRIIFSDAPLLGVNNINIASINVAPNPVKSVLNLNASEAISEITIYNIHGQQLRLVTPMETTYSLNMEGLPSGIYFAKVRSQTANKTFKLIKN